MKKVLFVVDERKLGGVSILLESILNNLDNKNLDITVLVLHNNGDRLENIQAKVIYGTPAFNIIDQDLKYLIKNFKLVSAIKKIVMSLRLKTDKIQKFILSQRNKLGVSNYDIEIAFKAGFCSAFVAYGNAKTKINWIHEDYATFNRTKRYENTFNKIFNKFDKHITVSNDAKKSFCDIYGCNDKTYVIENYIDTKSLLEKANEDVEEIVANSYKIDKDKLNLVALGRFCPEKGFYRIIQAFARLKEQGVELSNVHMYIIGYGEDEKKLNEDIIRLNLSENIDIINNSNLKWNPYAFMKQCDMYILSSTSESFGMVRVEALTLKLPVLTTNVANTEEILQNKYGLVVENSAEGVYQGLKEVITNGKLILSLKEKVKDYSYDEKNKEILERINRLLEE